MHLDSGASNVLVKPAGTAVAPSCSCVSAVQGSGSPPTLLQMKNKPTCISYLVSASKVTVPLCSVPILLPTPRNIWNSTHNAGSFARVNAEREKQRRAGDVLAAVQLSPSTHWIYSTVGVAETQLWTVVRHECFWQRHLQKSATPCTEWWRQLCNQG